MTQGTRQEELDLVNGLFPDSPTPSILPEAVRRAFAFLIASSWNLAEDGQGSGNMPAPGNQTLVQYVTLPQAQALLPNSDGTGPMNVVPGLLYVISGFAGGQLVAVEGLNSGFFASEGYQLDTSDYAANKVTVDVRGGAISQPTSSPSPTYSFANIGGSPADNLALVQYIAAYGPSIAELVYGTPVALNQWVVATNGIWQARRSFTPNALPQSGANWRLIAAFGGSAASTAPIGTEAGRAMLNAPSAGAQRTLLNGLNIAANQYALNGGTHPAFTQEDGPTGVTAWLLGQVAALNAGMFSPAQPAAPTAGIVDDTGDTFSFLPNPDFPAYTQYKVGNLPGQSAPVLLDSQNSYVEATGRIYIHVVGAVPRRTLLVYVAGVGQIPDGKTLTNLDPFTSGGGTVTPPPTTYTATVQSYTATSDDYLAKCGKAAPSGYQGPTRTNGSATSTVSQADANQKALAAATQAAKDAIVCAVPPPTYEWHLIGPSDADATGVTLTTDGGAYDLSYNRIYNGDSTAKRMDLFLPGTSTQLAAVDFPAAYLGQGFTFKVGSTLYTGVFTDGAPTLTASPN